MEILLKFIMITPDIKSTSKKNIRIRAVILGLILLFLTAASIGMILRAPAGNGHLLAYIYQDGALLETIDLAAVTESYTFRVDTAEGGFNEIAVAPGSIRMTEADCPDRLCVNMGDAASTMLPIVCLPNGLVIEIKKSASAGEADTAVDIITY